MTNYRLDRRYVLPSIGLHLIAAGVAAALAFLVWGPIGVVAGLLLLDAARLAAFPPRAVRTEPTGARVGGTLVRRPDRIVWKDVEDVSVDRGHLVVRQSGEDVVALPLSLVGARSGELVRDVYDRLNAANGYSRFDPDA